MALTNLVYAQFDSTPATLVADLKAKILLSASWSNITGNIVKATATNGAELVVDLNGSAPTGLLATFTVWRTHNGTSGTDSITRYVTWKKTGATSATSDPIHVQVSAHKDGLYIAIEGPRVGETNYDTTNTPYRGTFVLAPIVPYYDGTTDPVAAVCCIAQQQSSTAAETGITRCAVSRNAANNASWVPAAMETVCQPNTLSGQTDQGNRVGPDGKFVLRPWVVSEIAAGDRGRLHSVYMGGWFGTLGTTTQTDTPIAAPGQRTTKDGNTYELQLAGKSTVNAAYHSWGWGRLQHQGSAGLHSVLLAVPVS